MSGCGPSPGWGGIAAGGCGVAGSSSTILWSGTTEQGCGLRKEWRRYKICVVSLLFSDAALHGNGSRAAWPIDRADPRRFGGAGGAPPPLALPLAAAAIALPRLWSAAAAEAGRAGEGRLAAGQQQYLGGVNFT